MVSLSILVRSGGLPVHSFDLYGPLIDSMIMAEQTCGLFGKIYEKEGIAPEAAQRIMDDYTALCRGEPSAVGAKKQIIDAIHIPLDKYPDLQPDYQKAFQEDGLYALKQILDAGEGVIVFSTTYPEWLKSNLPDGIAKQICIYAGNKTQPRAFQQVYDAERIKKRRVVTHTADELPELEAAVKSGVFGRRNLVFVNRNDNISKAEVKSAGIRWYVANLREVDYTRLAQHQQTT